MNIAGLFANNAMIKNAAFGMLKKYFKDDGVKAVVITPADNEQGFDVQVLEETQHIVPDADFQQMKNALIKQLQNEL